MSIRTVKDFKLIFENQNELTDIQRDFLLDHKVTRKGIMTKIGDFKIKQNLALLSIQLTSNVEPTIQLIPKYVSGIQDETTLLVRVYDVYEKSNNDHNAELNEFIKLYNS